MEFLQVFLYSICGFSLMSLKDISNVRHLDMEKLVFVKSNKDVVKMITKLQDDYVLVVMNDINNFLNVPVTFVPTTMNFTSSERTLITMYGHLLDECDYDYIFNFTENNMIYSTLSIRERDQELFGSVSGLLKRDSNIIQLNINKEDLVNNYINYTTRFKNILNKSDRYDDAIFNTFRNYDLAIGI